MQKQARYRMLSQKGNFVQIVLILIYLSSVEILWPLLIINYPVSYDVVKA